MQKEVPPVPVPEIKKTIPPAPMLPEAPSFAASESVFQNTSSLKETKAENHFVSSAPPFVINEKKETMKEIKPFEAPLPEQPLVFDIPEHLPVLPPLSGSYEERQTPSSNFNYYSTMKEEAIPSFAKTYFEANDIDDLPALEISSSEDLPETYVREDIKKPLYIRTDYYSQVLSTIDAIKSYVNNSSDRIYSLENLKKNSDIEHKNYKKTIEDIQKKLIYIDKVLFQKEGAV
jgi:hypothetical protein